MITSPVIEQGRLIHALLQFTDISRLEKKTQAVFPYAFCQQTFIGGDDHFPRRCGS